MDISIISDQAIAAIAGHMTRLGAGIINHAENTLVGNLQKAVFDRLHATRIGSRILGDLERQPDNVDVQRAAKDALADEATRDRNFAALLAHLVSQLQPTSQGQVGDGALASGNTNITTTGGWDNRRGVVATSGARVDQSRRTRIGTGGLVAILVAVAVVSFGLGSSTVIIYNSITGSGDGLLNAGGIDRIVGAWYETAAPSVRLRIERNGDVDFGGVAARVTSPSPGTYRFELTGGIESQVFQGTLDQSGNKLTLVRGQTIEEYARCPTDGCPSG